MPLTGVAAGEAWSEFVSQSTPVGQTPTTRSATRSTSRPQSDGTIERKVAVTAAKLPTSSLNWTPNSPPSTGYEPLNPSKGICLTSQYVRKAAYSFGWDWAEPIISLARCASTIRSAGIPTATDFKRDGRVLDNGILLLLTEMGIILGYLRDNSLLRASFEHF